jgi:hypothetical protein
MFMPNGTAFGYIVREKSGLARISHEHAVTAGAQVGIRSSAEFNPNLVHGDSNLSADFQQP